MRSGKWTQIIAAALFSTAFAMPAPAAAQAIPRNRIPPLGPITRSNTDAYNRGYEQGLKEGEKDGRKNRAYQPTPNGNGRRARDLDYRDGFSTGYRVGYDQSRRVQRQERREDRRDGRREDRRDDRIYRDDRRQDGVFRRVPGGYQEPATARGYSDGYQRGLDDGRDRRRYDPVGEKDYREADQGYYGGYGSKDAYKNNYRAGFRQGYEDGYRDGNLRGR